MEDHTGHSNGGSSPISGSSVAAWAQRFVVRALESSGDEKLKRFARVIKEAPELLGEKTGPLLAKLFARKSRGEKLSPQDEKDLAETLVNNPGDAAVVMGIAGAAVLDGTVAAADERKAILASYKLAFDMVCAYMSKAETSVALRGFLHDEACISYWHFERSNLELSDGKDYLYPNGLEIYVLEEEPTLERLVNLNSAIRDSDTRHLSAGEYDFEKNDNIAKVTRINETTILLEQLAKDRAVSQTPRTDPFGLTRTHHTRPVEHVARIPAALSALGGLIDSLYDAKEVQGYRLEQARRAADKNRARA